jgi:hypothetical protein
LSCGVYLKNADRLHSLPAFRCLLHI